MKIAIIQITDKCNYKCQGCAPTNKAHADIGVIVAAIEQSGAKVVSLTGGEPTLYPNLFEMVERLHDRRIIVHMATNGSSLRELPAIEALTVSLDSDKAEEHNAYRGNPSAYANAYRTILHSRKIKHIPTYANLLVLPFNYNRIPDICRFVNKELDVPLTLCYPEFGSYLFNKDVMTSPNQIAHAFRSAYNDYGNAQYGNGREYYRLAAYYADGGRDAVPPCKAGESVVYIDLAGVIWPCFKYAVRLDDCQNCMIECFREMDMISIKDMALWAMRYLSMRLF